MRNPNPPAPITQRELEQLLEDARVAKRYNLARANIRERLKSGAMIEPGPITPMITTKPVRRWSQKAVAAVLGIDAAKALFGKLKAVPSDYLRILINGRTWNASVDAPKRLSNTKTAAVSAPSVAATSDIVRRLLAGSDVQMTGKRPTKLTTDQQWDGELPRHLHDTGWPLVLLLQTWRGETRHADRLLLHTHRAGHDWLGR
jgi:hypothetical protein